MGRFKFLTIDEIFDMPDPEYLIDDFIPESSFAQLYGPSDLGKTFVVLDMALSVATGVEWMGRKVRQGPVVYFAAEGSTSMKFRIRAWAEQHGFGRDDIRENFRLIAEALPLARRNDVRALIREIKNVFPDRIPSLVVLDTQAQCTEGVDEDNAGEMSVIIGAANMIKFKTGAAVLLIHHTGVTVLDRARGSGSVYNALNTQIALEGKSYSLQLVCKKQKDDSKFKPIHIKLVKVGNSLVSVARRA